MILIFCILKKKKKYPGYVSKHNSNHEKQVILLMISIREKWHYFAVKNLSAFGDFFCLNCFHSFATENKLQLHKEAFENKDFCTVNIPSADTKILQFDQYQKSEKASFIIYTDLECKIEKIDGRKK